MRHIATDTAPLAIVRVEIKLKSTKPFDFGSSAGTWDGSDVEPESAIQDVDAKWALTVEVEKQNV